MSALDPAHSTQSLVRATSLAFRRWRVRVVRGPDQGVERDIDVPEFSIGSGEGNDLTLGDPSVSRHHCAIRAVSEGHLLCDLDSKNGTYLAGCRIKTAYLKDGASVSVGATTLSVSALAEHVSLPISAEDRFDTILGASPIMRRIFCALPKLSESDLTVLLEGETGTGKGLIAEAIHGASPRARRPFVVIDCSSIPPTLIESELFGHTKGAFTGAHAARPGAFEAASGGTIFLDEIGELSLPMQPKLLRALEERTVKRIGSVEPTRIDVRVIAATNRDLRQEVNRGNFRADLFYRLNVVRIHIPPLRERPEDIPMLVAHFYRQVAAEPEQRPPAELIAGLISQAWPGNVRELRSAVERAVLMEDIDLWRQLSEGKVVDEGKAPLSDADVSFRAAKERAVAQWEREYLSALVNATDGNLSAAARRARMDRNHLRELLLKHGIVTSKT